MTTNQTTDGESIDTEPQRLEYGSVEFEEIDATGRTEHAALQLPDLLDSEAEVALSPDGQIRVFVDARAEVDGAGYLGATLLCDAEIATELGYALIQAGRDADERDE
jgi:hypothetical protein